MNAIFTKDSESFALCYSQLFYQGKTRVENPTNTRVSEYSSLCPEKSTKYCVHEFPHRTTEKMRLVFCHFSLRYILQTVVRQIRFDKFGLCKCCVVCSVGCGAGSVGFICFWVSWIRIRIHYQFRVRFRIRLHQSEVWFRIRLHFRGTDPDPYQNATDPPMFVNVFVYAIERYAIIFLPGSAGRRDVRRSTSRSNRLSSVVASGSTPPATMDTS